MNKKSELIEQARQAEIARRNARCYELGVNYELLDYLAGLELKIAQLSDQIQRFQRAQVEGMRP